VADTYRNAALAVSARGKEQVTPYQMQAITWLHQQAANQAEDAAGEGRGGIGASHGRVASGNKQWAKWIAYAGQQHIPVESGTTALSMLAGDEPDVLLSSQVDLGWRDAWRHEMRGPHGEWVRSPADSVSGSVLDRAPAGRAAGPDLYAGDPLRVSPSDTPLSVSRRYALRGKQVLPGMLGGGHSAWDGRVRLFPASEKPAVAAQLDWDGRMEVQSDIAKSMQRMLSHPDTEIDNPDPFAVELHELIHSIIPENETYAQHSFAYQDYDTAQIEEGFTELGTIQHAPEFFSKTGVGGLITPLLATDSEGHVIDNPEYDKAKAAIITGLKSKARALKDGEATTHIANAIMSVQADDPQTALDEIDKVPIQYDDDLYENRQAIHALDNITSGRHATLSEYAQRIQTPDHIKNGAWGHYAAETARAYAWTALVAQRMTGKDEYDPETQDKIRELSDEVNRQGPAGKMSTMASQVALAELGTDTDPDKLYHAALAAEQAIKFTWGQNDPASTLRRASSSARRVAQQQ
jgi:hypothetical protein